MTWSRKQAPPKHKDLDLRALFAARDARGLDSKEKVFVFVVASRGLMFTSAETAAADMGMSRASFYRTRDALIRKGYLRVEPRPNATTVYELKSTSEWLAVPHTETTPSHPETPPSHPESQPSHDETPGSQADDEKVTTKAPLKKIKKTPKKQLRGPPCNQATKPVARRPRVQ
ncbi:hypothetical protein BH24ACT12_BH24ACT12_14100 [soil metagenome]